MATKPSVAADDLRRLAGQWERNAQEDPLWVILSDPRRVGGRWNEDEFFATGSTEWQAAARTRHEIDLPPSRERVRC